jgi:hypothetical protein
MHQDNDGADDEMMMVMVVAASIQDFLSGNRQAIACGGILKGCFVPLRMRRRG